MDMIQRFRIAAKKRAEYRRTLAALRGLPTDVALDLDLYPGDARQIAQHAVYGR